MSTPIAKEIKQQILNRAKEGIFCPAVIFRTRSQYQHKRPLIDEEARHQIEAVLADHPACGHKRIALALKLNKKRILKVMKKYQIKPYRRRRKPRKIDDEGKPSAKYENLIEGFCPVRAGVVWVSDFTYIRFQERFIYLSTIMDQFTRELVEAIHQTMYYYNHQRIHTSLKMPPVEFRKQFERKGLEHGDNLSSKLGT